MAKSLIKSADLLISNRILLFELIEKANFLVKKSPLKFSASDIKYIIVKSEKEIPDFVEYIEKYLAD